MAVTLVTVTHQFLNPDQTAASGMIAFRLSGQMTNGSTTYGPTVPVHAALDSDGDLSQLVPANNDPATVPQGTSYTVTLFLNGDSAVTFSDIVVPYNAPGGTVDLGTLLPSQVGE
jgi:hypothetical protein